MGREFEVIITATGKHYLVGEVVRESLVHAPSRPSPLPHGAISGVDSQHQDSLRTPSDSRGSSWVSPSDALLMTAALVIVVTAVLFHWSPLSYVFR